MTTLHAIFRARSGQWETYSAPVSIYSGGTTRDEALAHFRDAGQFHFEDAWSSVEVTEHIERGMAPGLFVRIAQDGHARRRDDLAAALEGSFHENAAPTTAWDDALEASTGDVILVCCVPEDRLGWVGEQLGPLDAVHIVARAPDGSLASVTLVARERGLPTGRVLTFADLGLEPGAATVGELLAAVGHPLDTSEAGGETALLTAV